jgi:hypothetical protein
MLRILQEFKTDRFDGIAMSNELWFRSFYPSSKMTFSGSKMESSYVPVKAAGSIRNSQSDSNEIYGSDSQFKKTG